MSSQIDDATRSKIPVVVDNTDWLKTFAIVLVAIDHFGYFFIEDADWWSVVGRLAAPVFFFLLGYAQSRVVPLSWIWLGLILTLLESSNTDWSWVTPNILLSLAFVRIARPYVQSSLQHHGWVAFALLVAALLALLPIAAHLIDYGVEGWLWALFGLCQRMFVDNKLAIDGNDIDRASPAFTMPGNVGRMRLLACGVAAVVYAWQEQKEFSFSQIQFTVFLVGLIALSLTLCLFSRGPSRLQPSELSARVVRFVGRHTLEIYAFQLAGSELIIKLLPDLAA